MTMRRLMTYMLTGITVIYGGSTIAQRLEEEAKVKETKPLVGRTTTTYIEIGEAISTTNTLPKTK
jgi:hypothetical protein